MNKSRQGATIDGGDIGDVTINADGSIRELTKEEKRSIREKMKKLKLEGRLLPDSAMTTYFGKPAFHSYGKGNIKPTVGGVNYGHNLLTHNINAECGDNPPLYQQVYDNALKAGIVKTKGMRVPQIPIVKSNVHVSE